VTSKDIIIGFPHPPANGGPGSFQIRLEKAVKERGWTVVYPNSDITPDVILVVGGTRKLWWLWYNRHKGVPIVHRLAGLNWMHRQRKGIKAFSYAEIANFLMRIIRNSLADEVVYQSDFVEKIWRQKGGNTVACERIIYNAVDLSLFYPAKMMSDAPLKIICVEGVIDYSPYAVALLNTLAERMEGKSNYGGIILYGDFIDKGNADRLTRGIEFRGRVPRNNMPEVYRDGVFLSLDVNAACPNTVIEALASGIPVIGFDTGALKELVPSGAGEVVPYGSDPWLLEFPDIGALVLAFEKISHNWLNYSIMARKTAEQRFGLENMAEEYLKVFQKMIKK